MLSNNSTLIRVSLFILSGILLLSPEAQAFTDNVNLLPDSRADQPLLENIAWIFVIAALLFVVAVVFFGFGDLIIGVIASFADARRTNDWGPFLRSIAIVAVIIIIVLLLAGLLFELAQNIDFNPTINLS